LTIWGELSLYNGSQFPPDKFFCFFYRNDIKHQKYDSFSYVAEMGLHTLKMQYKVLMFTIWQISVKAITS